MELDTFLKGVGHRIEAVREARGLTRRELGIAIGLGEPSASAGVYGVEMSGRATQIDTIFKLAKALGVTPGFLLDGGELTLEKKVSV